MMHMLRRLYNGGRRPAPAAGPGGFTLLELLVAMAVAGVLLAGIYEAHQIQQTTYRNQNLVVEAQQNVRGAMYLIERDMRMMGYDETNSGRFGVTDIRDVNGWSAIQFTADWNGNGEIDAAETITYSIEDMPVGAPDGVPDLARDAGGGRQLMAEGIEGLGLSYAFEGATPNQLATDPVTGEVIWAVDSDGDNDLDFDVVAGAALPSDQDLDDILAVRIQILGRTTSETLGLQDDAVYQLGRRTYGPALYNRRHQHRYMSSTVKCRNLGL